MRARTVAAVAAPGQPAHRQAEGRAQQAEDDGQGHGKQGQLESQPGAIDDGRTA